MRRQALGERDDDLAQVDPAPPRPRAVPAGDKRLAQPVEGRVDEALDVADDALLELAAVMLTLLEQDPQGRVALIEDRRLAAQGALRAFELLLNGALRLAGGELGRALVGHIAHGADHARRLALLVGQDHALVARSAGTSRRVAQAVLTAKRVRRVDALADRLGDTLAVVRVKPVEPAADVAWEAAGAARAPRRAARRSRSRRSGCSSRRGFEGNAQESTQPGVVVGQRRLRGRPRPRGRSMSRLSVAWRPVIEVGGIRLLGITCQ